MIERDDPEDKDLAALYRAASTEEPPAGLDARILAAAREAAVPRAPRPSFATRWRVPFALAASVVLATSLTVLVREQKEDPSQLGTPAETAQPAPPAAPPAAAPTAGATAKTAPPTAEPARAETRQAKPEHSREANRPAPRAADEARRDAKSDASAASAASSGSLAAERKAAQAAPAAAAIQAAPAAPAANALPGAPADSAMRSPEQWLEEIRRLRHAGHQTEADASLAEFRKRYPDYPLPEDLKTP